VNLVRDIPTWPEPAEWSPFGQDKQQCLADLGPGTGENLTSMTPKTGPQITDANSGPRRRKIDVCCEKPYQV